MVEGAAIRAEKFPFAFLSLAFVQRQTYLDVSILVRTK